MAKGPLCHFLKRKSIITLINLFVSVIIRVKIRSKHSRWINMVNTGESVLTGILDAQHSSHSE